LASIAQRGNKGAERDYSGRDAPSQHFVEQLARVVDGARRCRRSHENVIGARVRRDPGVMADDKEVAERGAAVEQGVEKGVEGPSGAPPGEGRVREGAARGGGEAGAAVGGDDTAEELLAGPGTRGGGGGSEAGEDGLHGREEARGGEPGDDEVVAAERVAERRRGGRRVEEEAERGGGVQLAAERRGEVVRRELVARHGSVPVGRHVLLVWTTP